MKMLPRLRLLPPLAAAFVLATGALPLLAQTLVDLGKVDVELTLDPGLNWSWLPGGAPAVYPSPGRGAVTLDSSTKHTYNISAYSPGPGESYWSRGCPSLSNVGLIQHYPPQLPIPLDPTYGTCDPLTLTHPGDVGGHFIVLSGTRDPLTYGDDWAIPAWVDCRLDLGAGGRTHYFAKGFRSGSLVPYDDQDPLWTTEFRTWTEPVGAIRLKLPDCPNHSPGWALSPGMTPYVTATIVAPGDNAICNTQSPYHGVQSDPPWLSSPDRVPGSPGTVQASVDSPTGPNATWQEETFLVRAGLNYKVTMLFGGGTDPYADSMLGEVSATTSSSIQPGVVHDLQLPALPGQWCDNGGPCYSAVGRLELLPYGGANPPAINPPSIFLYSLNHSLDPGLDPVVGIYHEPYFDNHRLAHVDPPGGFVGPIPSDICKLLQYQTAMPTPMYPLANFLLQTVYVDQDSGPGQPPKPDHVAGLALYQPSASMYFHTASGLEWFHTPEGNFTDFHCFADGSQNACTVGSGLPSLKDLDNLLVLNPGIVTGNIRLKGPSCGAATTCLQWIQEGGNDLLTSPRPIFWSWNSGNRVSYVEARGGADPLFEVSHGGGIADVSILQNTALSTPTEWVGSYELWLAGLDPNKPSSSWGAPGLGLYFKDPTPGNQDVPMGSVNVGDNPQLPDVMPHSSQTRNFQYCFGEIDWVFDNSAHHYEIADPSVSCSGGYIGLDPYSGVGPADYTVSAGFSGTPTHFGTGDGHLRICLPAGTYTLSPSIGYNNSGTENRVSLFPSTLNLACGECKHIVTPVDGKGPSLILNYDCASGSTFSISGMVQAQTVPPTTLTSVKLRLNSNPGMVLCGGTGPACGSTTFNFNQVIPLPPCSATADTLTVTATDSAGNSISPTITIQRPPVILYCPSPTWLTAGPDGHGGCSVAIPDLTASVSVCAGATVTQDPVPGGTWGLGEHTVVFTASNACGTTYCSTTVTVESFHFRCPANITTPCTYDDGAIVYFTDPVPISACCPLVNLIYDPPSGHHFPIGVTSAKCTASDACGNTQICYFVVAVTGPKNAVQAPLPRWAFDDGGANMQHANGIAVDATGNSYVVGTFSGTATFAGSSPITLTGAGGEDVFLAKYDTSGKVLWAVWAGDTANDQGLGVAVDSQGNCFITGSFHGSPTFGNADQVTFQTLTWSYGGGSDIFLAKYDPSGTLLWVRADGGAGDDLGEAVAVDSAGNAYVTGAYTGAATFGPFANGSLGYYSSLLGAGGQDCFLIKYDSAGFARWANTSRGLPGLYSANGRGVAVSTEDKVWVTGNFTGNASFGMQTVSAGTHYNAFVAHYDQTTLPGWKWGRQTAAANGAAGNHDGRAIGVDRYGNCYFTAYFSGSATLLSSVTLPGVTAQAGYYDFLVGSYAPDGTGRWLRNGANIVGYNWDQESRALTVDPDGNVYVTGFLGGLSTSADGGANVWLAHLDAWGYGLWVRQAVGTSPDYNNAGRGIAVDLGGCVYVTGSSDDSALTFQGMGKALNKYNGDYATDLFLAKYCSSCDCGLPTFAEVPVSVNAYATPSVNAPASFTVIALGSLPLRFYWYNGSTLINPGGVAGTFGCYVVDVNGSISTLKVECGLTGSAAGSFHVVIENDCCQQLNNCSAVSDPVWILDKRIPWVDWDHGQPRIRVAAPNGVHYQVQYRDDFAPETPWQVLADVLASGTNIAIVDPNPSPTARFYRLALFSGAGSGFPLFMNCPHDKTVECGSAWSFDTPAPFSQCSSTNVAVTVLSTLTNGACPMHVTRTWLITDACTNSAQCRQTVTVQDTTPPVLLCASNKTVTCYAGFSQVTYTNLRSFRTNGIDGQIPYGGLMTGADGALYGTTYMGGSNGVGTVFKINPDGSGYTVLRSFSTNGVDGHNPNAPLLAGSDGALYGTTYSGGSNGVGTVFKLTTNGAGFTLLRSFVTSGGDAWWPVSGLMAGSDGTLYGTSYAGGSNGVGTVFRLNSDGSGYAVLHHFLTNGVDGGIPYSALLAGSDGALYGTTSGGGSNKVGTVFKLGTNGVGYAVLHQFITNSVDGRILHSGLIEARDGYLYGTTWAGGSNSAGTVFRLDKTGASYSVLRHFSTNTIDGMDPYDLVQGADGALYGVTHSGGSNTVGTVFKLSTDGGGYAMLQSFSTAGNDGRYLRGALVQGNDGAFYGLTENGGTNNAGILFRLTSPCSWNFDAPMAVDACSGTNVTLTVLSTVTNGAAPPLITRTWQATDACGKTNACSQTVTILSP